MNAVVKLFWRPLIQMLKYAKQFYKRHFINQKQHAGKITTEFDKILQHSIREGLLVTNGLPAVRYLADKLHVSLR